MNRPLLVLATMATLLAPSRLLAHAHLKRSSPSAGARLSTAPQLIQLWFSERPEVAATFGSLKDSGGRIFELSAAEREPSGVMGVRFRVLGTLQPGRYTLSWRTVAADGHASAGKFGFVVLGDSTPTPGRAPHPTGLQIDSTADAGALSPPNRAPPEATSSDAENADAAGSVANSIARAFLFVGLLALIGAITFKLLVLRAALATPKELAKVMSHRAALIGAGSALLVIVVGVVRLYLESRMMAAMPDMPGMEGMGARAMVMHTEWGLAYQIQMVAAITSLVGFALVLRDMSAGWSIAAVAALVISVTPALGGHAAASPRFTSLMVVADSLHVLGGSAWLGSLFCVMAIGVPVARSIEPPQRWAAISSIVNAFSPVALVSAGIVVASGIFASWVHLERISALWQTTYGKTLLVKLLFVAITLGIGGYNFRKVQPQLLTAAGTERLRQSAAAELVTGVVILLVTGLLTGISP